MTSRTTLYDTDSLAVATYDAEYAPPNPSIDGDVEFYLGLARQTGGPVLELGAGTGRVAWPLAAQGIRAVGLDKSPAMLRRAEAKRNTIPATARGNAEFVAGDMADFELDRTFALVIVPYRSFQLLLTPEDQRRSLTCIRRHLREAGLLVLHLFDPRLDLLAEGGGRPLEQRQLTHPDTGNVVNVEIAVTRADPLDQLLYVDWRHTEVDSHGAVLRQEEERLVMRWTYRWELRHLLELSGFAIEAEYSDFKGAAPAYGGEQIVVARRR